MRGVRIRCFRRMAAVLAGCAAAAACGQGSPTSSVGNQSVSPAVSAALSAPRPSPIATATPEAPLVEVPVPGPQPVATNRPTAQATPATCPPLTSWVSKIHWITDSDDRQVQAPVANGFVIVDSTPQFAGRACNAESDGCDGRRCEDPRGGNWVLLEGDSRATSRANGYQLRIGPLRSGKHRWRVCPQPGARDAEGVLLVIAPEPCSEGQFQVP